MKREISLAACCAALLSGSPAARATPFGELYHPRETPAFASATLDPTIAKWLMTLPQDAGQPQPAAGDPELAGRSAASPSPAHDQLADERFAGDPLAGTPIGGEAHELMPPERSASAAPPAAQGPVTAQMLEAAPVGGEVYRLTGPAHADVTASIAKPEPARPQATAGEAPATLAKPETGIAVWYRLPGRTASGEVANPHALTAGHRTLPLGSRVRVVNRLNGASVVVRINDRGPRQKKFVIDLSQASAKAIGLTGTAPVTLNVEQWGAVAANTPRTPALEGRRAVKHGAAAKAR
jgi:rare lipoprotein A